MSELLINEKDLDAIIEKESENLLKTVMKIHPDKVPGAIKEAFKKTVIKYLKCRENVSPGELSMIPAEGEIPRLKPGTRIILKSPDAEYISYIEEIKFTTPQNRKSVN
jgi:hypothetical protein